jgi:hypothetical protein
MTSEEIAYIAVIIDGEGSIMLIKFHKNQFPSPCISIISTTFELLEWIRKTSGMGTIKGKKNYDLNKYSNSFVYTLKYEEALLLLKLIEPYLVINTKKIRAKFILDYYKKLTPRNGKYTKEMLEAKNKFYQDFMDIK